MEKLAEGVYLEGRDKLIMNYDELLKGSEDDFETNQERECYEDGYTTAWMDAMQYFKSCSKSKR